MPYYESKIWHSANYGSFLEGHIKTPTYNTTLSGNYTNKNNHKKDLQI